MFFVLLTAVMSMDDVADLIPENDKTWVQMVKYAIVTISAICFTAIVFNVLKDGLGYLSFFF